MTEFTLSGRSRYRSMNRGLWPFRSAKLVLQVEETRTDTIVEDFTFDEHTVSRTYWRDAEFGDLSIDYRRELFVRENPR